MFDQGEIDERASAASNGLLSVGSPWLALELVEGGTLSGLYRNLNWQTLKSCPKMG